jgi:hypothetical protein
MASPTPATFATGRGSWGLALRSAKGLEVANSELKFTGMRNITSSERGTLNIPPHHIKHAEEDQSCVFSYMQLV